MVGEAEGPAPLLSAEPSQRFPYIKFVGQKVTRGLSRDINHGYETRGGAADAADQQTDYWIAYGLVIYRL